LSLDLSIFAAKDQKT